MDSSIQSKWYHLLIILLATSAAQTKMKCTSKFSQKLQNSSSLLDIRPQFQLHMVPGVSLSQVLSFNIGFRMYTNAGDFI